MASDEMIFQYVSANLAFRLPWQIIKFRTLDKNDIFCTGLLKEYFHKTFVKITAVIAINANFHFSHYNSI